MAEALPASAADLAACRARLRHGSKSFDLASRLLPRQVREPTAVLYAFCREADDLVDLEGGRSDAIQALDARLDRIYAIRPADDSVERALTAVVHRFALPRPLFDALIEGLAWDAAGRHCADLAALEAYAARVAGTVGVMATLLMGVRHPGALARAADLGVAMQLTNIARDVGEDARAGRLYLPEQWLRDAGLDPDAWLARPAADPRLDAVLRRLLEAADRLYRQAAPGIAHLPLACRPAIHAARLIYGEIGREVERRRYDSISGRAVVPAGRKLRLLGAAVLESWRDRAAYMDLEAAPLDATRFLVEAVAAMPADAADLPAIPWWDLDRRIGWTIELFARLERRERLAGRR
jgi:phytoene synthase